MKIFRFIFDDPPNFAVKRQGPTKRAKNSFAQGDKQFLRAAVQGDQRNNATLDAEGRHWPELPSVPQNRIATLESKIAKQSAELTQRCSQVADLCNIREQQAIELHNACDQMDCLSESIAGLQDTIVQHETEAAAAKQKLLLSDNEKFALRAQLDKAKAECADLLQRSLRAETALNDKDMVIASTQEKVENLKAILIAIPAETIRLTTAIEEEANTRHRHELDRQRAHFEKQINDKDIVIASTQEEVEDLKAKLIAVPAETIRLTTAIEEKANTRRRHELDRQRAHFESQISEKDMVIASTQEEVEDLKAKLIAISAETIRLTTAIEEEASTRHRHDLDQQRAHFESQIKKLEGIVVQRDMLLKDLEIARAKLAEHCNDLSKTVTALESTRRLAQERIELQTGNIQALETLFRIQREALELKIKELTVELQCERVKHTASERTSAAIRKNIVLLLPKLVARRDLLLSREQEKSVSHNTAA
jgi:chromosome segregation ATPase